MTERWMTIESHPAYEVSDQGRVKRAVGGQGSVAGKILSPFLNGGGYDTVLLYRNGRRKQDCVHRLVAAAFLGPKPSGLQVNHRDGRKRNNTIVNLEYVSAGENVRHAHRLGIAARGGRVNTAKLAAVDVRAIRKALKHGEKAAQIAERYSVGLTTIRDIANGQSWAWLAG